MPYLHISTEDVYELVNDLGTDDKKTLLNELLDSDESGDYIAFSSKIRQMHNEITAVELECADIELPKCVRELLYQLTGREIGK